MKLQRLGPALLAPALLLGLAGCSSLAPGTAARVGETRIAMSEVDELADAQCNAAEQAAQAGQSTTTSVSRIRQQSLNLLIDIELTRQFAAAEDISADKQMVSSYFGLFEEGLAQLPEEDREVLEPLFRDWAQGRAALVAAGAEETGQPATTDQQQQQQLELQGIQVRDAWAEDVEVESDPRFAPGENGLPGGGDGSVSRPSSDFAKAATADEADPAWLTGLPAGQKCG